MNESKILMLYKPGSISMADVSKLEAAGFLCLAVKAGKFSDVSFPVAQGLGFMDGDTINVMMLRAADNSVGFSGNLGALIFKEMKKRAGIGEKKP